MPDFYDRHHTTYGRDTFSAGPSVFLDPLTAALPAGASVLDAGCGSGRDLLWLKNRGFQVTGFEKSAKMAALARKNADCPVLEGDFEVFDFSALLFDVVISVGSLVHIPRERLSSVITNISRALAGNGLFYISLKEGDSTAIDDTGRLFYLWRDRELAPLFHQLDFQVIHFSRTLSALNAKDRWLGYILQTRR